MKHEETMRTRALRFVGIHDIIERGQCKSFVGTTRTTCRQLHIFRSSTSEYIVEEAPIAASMPASSNFKLHLIRGLDLLSPLAYCPSPWS